MVRLASRAKILTMTIGETKVEVVTDLIRFRHLPSLLEKLEEKNNQLYFLCSLFKLAIVVIPDLPGVTNTSRVNWSSRLSY